MNRLERLIRIHRLLRSPRPVPMRRFTEDVGVSRNTITRDFEYLRDFLGAPIIYDRGANGHYYDPTAPAFEVPGFWLNQSELYALLATEQLLEAVQPGFLSPYLGPLKSRVRRLLGEGGRNADAINRRIRILVTGRRQLDTAHFASVAEAVLTGCRLRLAYHSRSRNAISDRIVHPQRLLSYRSNWYLIAYCEIATDIRSFSLDRVRTAQILSGPSRQLDDAAVDRAIGATYGIFSGTANDWAILRFRIETARWVAEEIWHPDQIGTWTGQHYELQVPYANPTELVMEILRYGPDVEVVAPSSLRSLVAERLAQAVAKY